MAGLPLGSTELICGGAVMINLLGYEDSQSDYLAQTPANISSMPNTYVHWYAKQSTNRSQTRSCHNSRWDGCRSVQIEIIELAAAALARQVAQPFGTRKPLLISRFSCLLSGLKLMVKDER